MNLLNRTKIMCAAVLVTSGLTASAALSMRITADGTIINVVDQGPNDFNILVGSVVYVGPVGGIWVQNASAGLSKPLIGGAENPHIDLNVQAITTDAAFVNSTLTIELTDTGFTANNTGVVSFGGNTDGTVTATTWVDAGNVPFARTTQLSGQGPFGPPVFESDAAINVTANAPYSLTVVATITHIGTGIPDVQSTTGFDLDLSVGPTPPEEAGAGCRVTGGGRQQDTFPHASYVTHGGQVGAPVGNETAFAPDTPCIQGNWQHVRHMKGGNKGNFHAKSFDSLMCACLGCPEDPFSPVTLGGLCNPGNRTCGPEPRKAPANKITFSGVGDYALSKGNRQKRSVLFRVDIEDRSEPGNSHAGGSKAPHDRHRIRIWILTPDELVRLKTKGDELLDFRMAISAGFGTPLKDGAILPDGTAVPNGTAVFGVRAPDIDDGGEMNHGNHQLHPSIKECVE